ncbi:MAG: flavin-containing monooxygenase [Actinomycetales bacterium]
MDAGASLQALPFRVAIIGAGFSGLAAAVALRKQGIDFEIFEDAEGIGGTWWKNRYPGAEVDLESIIYSFSYARYDWTRTHATWDELQRYLEGVADSWQITPHVHFKERVHSAHWSHVDGGYRLVASSEIDHGIFQGLISAVGFLNVPIVPPFATADHQFPGTVCHTASWPDGLTMDDRSVAVVGTGSSAVQIVEAAVATARDVTIYQLEPNWLLPKLSRPLTDEERRGNRHLLTYWRRRGAMYWDYDRRQDRTQHARLDGRAHQRRRVTSLQFLQESLADRPDLIPLVTPDFPFEGRRTVVSDTYYPSLKDPKVTLIPRGVTGLTPTGVQDASGDIRAFDIVVLATGFDAANYLSNLEVIGRAGADLHQRWAQEPEAFYGMMVPDFPNFFMMYGPNTNAIPLVSFYQTQATFMAKVLARVRRKGFTSVEVKPSAFRRFNDRLQKQLAKTVWAQTQSYFKAGTGKVVTQWPFSATRYILGTKVARRFALDYRR